MIKNLSEKEFNHAFFFSMKMKDYQHALYLLKLGASSTTSFFYAQDQLLYTISKPTII